MKLASFLALALAAGAAMAQTPPPTKVKIVPTPKVGDQQKLKWQMKTSFQGEDAVVTSNVVNEVKAVDGDVVEFVTHWNDFNVAIGESSHTLPHDDLDVRVKTDGTVLKVTGGIEGSDAPRTYLLLQFLPPADEIAAGTSYTRKFDADKAAGLPAHTVATTYVGPDKVGDQPAQKFVAHYSEPDSHLSAETTYWVKEDGTILKASCKFMNLPIPAIGQDADGSFDVQAIP